MSQFFQHQQQILHLMGIVQWVEPSQMTQPLHYSIWRDTADDVVIHDVTQNAEHQTIQDVTQPVISFEKFLHQDVEQRPTDLPDQALTQPQTVIPTIEYVKTAEPLAPKLNLHLYSVANVVMVVDWVNTTSAEQQLWHNIQQAIIKKYPHLSITQHYLTWQYQTFELNIEMMFDQYIQGFLDVHGAEKQCFVLGQLPYFQKPEQASHYRYFPSLTELLNQESSKRQLWQELQQCILM